MKKQEFRKLFESVYKEFSGLLGEATELITVQDYINAALKRGPVGDIAKRLRWGEVKDITFNKIIEILLDKYSDSKTSPEERQKIDATIQNAYYPHSGGKMAFTLMKKAGGSLDDFQDAFASITSNPEKWQDFLVNRKEKFGAQLLFALKNAKIDIARKNATRREDSIDAGDSEEGGPSMDRRAEFGTSDSIHSDHGDIEKKAVELIDQGGLTIDSFKGVASRVYKATQDAIESDVLKNASVGIAFAESLLGKSKDQIVNDYPEYFNTKADVGSALQGFRRPTSEREYKAMLSPIFNEIGLNVDDMSDIGKWNWIEKILKDPHGFELPKPEKDTQRFSEPKDFGYSDHDEMWANLEEEEVEAIMEAVMKRIQKELL